MKKINNFFIASLKNLGDKASSLFDRKKKEAGDLASEKATKAKTLAEDQLKKTSDAISGATSGATNLIAGASKDANDKKEDILKKTGKYLHFLFFK